MFICDFSSEQSAPREQPVQVVFEELRNHPQRFKKFEDEYGNEQNVLVDQGGTGPSIVKQLKIRKTELQAFLEQYPSARVLS